jgi:hypothetical protein
MTNEETDDHTKASGTASGEELRGAGTRTSPPGNSDTDEQAKKTGEEKLDQAGGGH